MRNLRGAHIRELSIKVGLFVCALLSVITTLGIVVILGKETIEFFLHIPITEFLTGTQWFPLLEPQSFGVLPLLCGTLLVVVGAAAIALPGGIATAVFLSEYASSRTRSIIKPILEILAGVPTVVYGYFALTFITPSLRFVFPTIEIFNATSAAIVVGIMILPMISSLCDDAFVATPKHLREGGYAMGATTFEVIAHVIIPNSASRIIAAVILALSRAMGETMAVTLAAGGTPKLTLNPLESIQTMTAYIVQVSLGDTPAGGIPYLTCFAVGSVLFVFTLGMNLLAQRVLFKVQKAHT